MKRLLRFLRGEAVLCAAVLLALGSMIAVPPDAAYAGYIDARTIAILFCLMGVTAGLQKLGLFRRIARLLLRRVRSMRQLMLLLTLLCFFSSMLITNDAALITFVPLTFSVWQMIRTDGKERCLIPVVVLQTVAANLGSMLTPIGNPQNLYLYGRSGMRLFAFLRLMLPYAALSLGLAVLFAVLLSRPAQGVLDLSAEPEEAPPDRKKLLMYGLLFLLSLLSVVRLLPYPAALLLVLVAMLLTDRGALLVVDYSLLGTFLALFVFIGNMGRVDAFRDFLRGIVAGREMLTAVAASQLISNVPAALLLSGFTENTAALIVGTNLGGLGTLIASMASLISFKLLAKHDKRLCMPYLGAFTAVNALFLAALAGLAFLLCA